MGYSLGVDAKYKLQAVIHITQLRQRRGTVAFFNIVFEDFIKYLEERLDDPYSIDQKNASLCGPAAVMFCWLCKRPDLFTQYVINVYETGMGKMGDLVVTPGEDCRNYSPATIKGVDWVALAALRDSENTVFDYDDETDQVSGITLSGAIEKWFKNIGFNVVENNADARTVQGYEALRKAASHLVQGKCVCLLVNAKFLLGEGFNIIANHWIVMTSEPKIDGKSISSLPNENSLLDKQINFTVYTWGLRWAIKIDQKNHTNTLKDFLDCFYGFVAAEYNDYSAFAAKVSLLDDQANRLKY